ncbi:MAG: phytanoyl-CoA dioxygenase family protein [Caldilineaceae bacterium]|nr:phytanoyl-CoA dioxygenase family protein [Caldilineaceae bacterium]
MYKLTGAKRRNMVPIMAMSQVSNTQSPVVTEAQRHHFRTFGFVAFPQLFTPAEIERYGQALERSLRRKRGGADFDGKERDVVNPMIEHDRDVFYPLLDDERLLGIVDGLLGEDSLFTGGNDGNMYVGSTPWHTDVNGVSPNVHMLPTMKTAFYCDPVADGHGCLSVIPGSHHPEVCRQLYDAIQAGVFDINSPDVPGRTPLESMPGDVMAFDHRLWHSSWGGKIGRRMFTFNWASCPKQAWEERMVPYSTGYKSERLMETAGARRRQKIAGLAARIQEMNRS